MSFDTQFYYLYYWCPIIDTKHFGILHDLTYDPLFICVCRGRRETSSFPVVDHLFPISSNKVQHPCVAGIPVGVEVSPNSKVSCADKFLPSQFMVADSGSTAYERQDIFYVSELISCENF